MDLHFDYLFAFHALDQKWGKPVDLDTSQDIELPCIPAVLDKPVTTFSSEEYLKKIKRSRPKPYNRIEEEKEEDKKQTDISISRILSVSNLERQKEPKLDIRIPENDIDLIGAMEDLIDDLQRPLERFAVLDQVLRSEETIHCGSTATLDSVMEVTKNEMNSVLEELKTIVISFVKKRKWNQ